MPKETLTSKERWLAVLQHQIPDRVPMDYWATEEASQRLMQYLGCDCMDTVYRRLHIDPVFTVQPKYIGPAERTGFLSPVTGRGCSEDSYF
jgi:uroporphyrinogen decarboxylase